MCIGITSGTFINKIYGTCIIGCTVLVNHLVLILVNGIVLGMMKIYILCNIIVKMLILKC